MQNELLGKEEIAILFEEMDGVWLKMQGTSKQEMKVAKTYEGWIKDDKKNTRLSNKMV